jgi:hypothetical protein
VLNEYTPALLSGPFARPVEWGGGCEGYIYNVTGKPVAFLSNSNTTASCTVSVTGAAFTVPAWSVTVVDLTTLTARYNSWTLSSNTLKLTSEYEKSIAHPLSTWSPPLSTITTWRDSLAPWPGANTLIQIGPAEQLTATHYTSAYLWYTVHFTTRSTVNSLHLQLSNIEDRFTVFVDDSPALLTSGIVTELTSFTVSVPGLVAGDHVLRLRNGLIGVNNVDINAQYFEQKGVRGQVMVEGVDLTNHIFTHVVGLHGEQLRLFDHAGQSRANWTAYRTSTPVGGHWLRFAMPTPVVVGDWAESMWQFNMSTMGKGQLYVNGHHVGQYWNITGTTGCGQCNFRGGYDPESCRLDCGQPSQSLYQVPRDWLMSRGEQAMNDVVVFEEEGGDPTLIEFRQRN